MLPVNTLLKPNALKSLLKTTPVPWRPDKALLHKKNLKKKEKKEKSPLSFLQGNRTSYKIFCSFKTTNRVFHFLFYGTFQCEEMFTDVLIHPRVSQRKNSVCMVMSHSFPYRQILHFKAAKTTLLHKILCKHHPDSKAILQERAVLTLCFLVLLTASEIKPALKVVICRSEHLSSTKPGNSNVRDCNPVFNSLLNGKPGKKRNVKLSIACVT